MLLPKKLATSNTKENIPASTAKDDLETQKI